ncbi:MAG: hypothetical protein N0E59_06175, partial [Candidatus Thiodiazotropha taylori]|nr:hypothetical protein [Candidatus Thiodiazotropha taylori]MCW4282678.1 hypothetical protein [Candidatus Thiodiazotropha taylori]
MNQAASIIQLPPGWQLVTQTQTTPAPEYGKVEELLQAAMTDDGDTQDEGDVRKVVPIPDPETVEFTPRVNTSLTTLQLIIMFIIIHPSLDFVSSSIVTYSVNDVIAI